MFLQPDAILFIVLLLVAVTLTGFEVRKRRI